MKIKKASIHENAHLKLIKKSNNNAAIENLIQQKLSLK